MASAVTGQPIKPGRNNTDNCVHHNPQVHRCYAVVVGVQQEHVELLVCTVRSDLEHLAALFLKLHFTASKLECEFDLVPLHSQAFCHDHLPLLYSRLRAFDPVQG